MAAVSRVISGPELHMALTGRRARVSSVASGGEESTDQLRNHRGVGLMGEVAVPVEGVNPHVGNHRCGRVGGRPDDRNAF